MTLQSNEQIQLLKLFRQFWKGQAGQIFFAVVACVTYFSCQTYGQEYAQVVQLTCPFPNGQGHYQITIDYGKGLVTYLESGFANPKPIISKAQITDNRITWRQTEMQRLPNGQPDGVRLVISYYLDRLTGELGYQYFNPTRGTVTDRTTCTKSERPRW